MRTRSGRLRPNCNSAHPCLISPGLLLCAYMPAFNSGGGMAITIYHNPRCETSRNVLALIRAKGQEPRIIEYLKTPPSRSELQQLIKRMGTSVGDVVRWKEPLTKELGLDKGKTPDAKLLDAMMAHPILINRPIVVTDRAVKLCRPSETVRELL